MSSGKCQTVHCSVGSHILCGARRIKLWGALPSLVMKRTNGAAGLVDDDEVASSSGSIGRVKRCRLCGCSSSDPNPILAGAMRTKWGECMPWWKGSPEKPTGNYDLLCVNAWTCAGYGEEYVDLTRYHRAIQDKTAINGPFLECRKKWVECANSTPDYRVQRHELEKVKVSAYSDEQDVMEGPDEEFVELECWREENKDENNVKPQPSDAGLQVVTRKLQGKTLQGVVLLRGKLGHFKLSR